MSEKNPFSTHSRCHGALAGGIETPVDEHYHLAIDYDIDCELDLQACYREIIIVPDKSERDAYIVTYARSWVFPVPEERYSPLLF